MRKSARLVEKRAKLESESQEEPNAKESRSNETMSNIVILDNGTMVEAFKCLNYCQLAKNSLVSKRFRDLIRTHRHKFALLYVSHISIDIVPSVRAVIKSFDKLLSSAEAFNKWVIRNSYSKQVPLECQVVRAQSAQNIYNGYWLNAYAHYNDLSHRGLNDDTKVFYARAESNHENWPVFQHFARLATDLFIYIKCLELTPQNDVLNLLAGAIHPNCRLQCKKLVFQFKGNSQISITWAKNHVRCSKFFIYDYINSNEDESLLDFFLTGAHCTASIVLGYRDHSKVVVDLLQKFVDLENSDEIQLVETIKGYFKGQSVEVIKRNYAEFIVKKEGHDDVRSTEQVIEFVNNKIGKKLQLAAKNPDRLISHFSIKIINL